MKIEEFAHQKSPCTAKKHFLVKYLDLGGPGSQYLRKTRFYLCFSYISYRKMPENTLLVLYFFVQRLDLRSLVVLLLGIRANFRQKTESVT